MTEREKAILWLSSFVKNKEPMTLIPKQLIRLIYEALTEQPDIVRCKDCEHQLEQRTGSCPYYTTVGSVAPDDWFCADGKRKSAEEKLMEEMDADPIG